MSYKWARVTGDALRPQRAWLTSDRFGYASFHPNNCRFSLTVSDGENTSKSAFVNIILGDDSSSPSA